MTYHLNLREQSLQYPGRWFTINIRVNRNSTVYTFKRIKSTLNTMNQRSGKCPEHFVIIHAHSFVNNILDFNINV